ncbi:hypothetical protein FOQG_07885 [Fusarium oxysporum f. sp. raphani 54005]|uniref:Uncharacterized protein n=1 Tax=Fusarium oxysporum f. sp. raphani 54005 TaxID=1089458 RepID=X0C4B0_FUSOX|nr:hypothetical protein FOQG_07885 [Fusarium oxysporum f. sp. raphani 54005]
MGLDIYNRRPTAFKFNLIGPTSSRVEVVHEARAMWELREGVCGGCMWRCSFVMWLRYCPSGTKLFIIR